MRTKIVLGDPRFKALQAFGRGRMGASGNRQGFTGATLPEDLGFFCFLKTISWGRDLNVALNLSPAGSPTSSIRAWVR